ncbi:MAG: dihydrofolate reductase family protein, partial [Candidatus Methylomirabilales bacterium]
AAGLIDRYIFYLAPSLMGGDGTMGVLQGWAAATIDRAPRLHLASVRRFGDDLRVVAYRGP